MERVKEILGMESGGKINREVQREGGDVEDA
jgi:hypothetical protein